MLGIFKDKHETTEGINVTKTYVKSLGIYIGHDRVECYNKNWMKTYREMEKLSESWKRRKLSIFGKCTIISTLALSKLTQDEKTIFKHLLKDSLKRA